MRRADLRSRPVYAVSVPEDRHGLHADPRSVRPAVVPCPSYGFTPEWDRVGVSRGKVAVLYVPRGWAATIADLEAHGDAGTPAPLLTLAHRHGADDAALTESIDRFDAEHAGTAQLALAPHHARLRDLLALGRLALVRPHAILRPWDSHVRELTSGAAWRLSALGSGDDLVAELAAGGSRASGA